MIDPQYADHLTPGQSLYLDSLLALVRAVVPEDVETFEQRLREQFPRLFALLRRLYGGRPDFDDHVAHIVVTAARMFADRPAELKLLDKAREQTPNWFQSETMMGAVCYVDRFAGTLRGMAEHLDYLDELGVTYLHLMPLFKCPAEQNDGGYAVSSFREVRADMGTMDELAALATTLRERGISLVLDFVFNHTSDEHDWALQARSGDPKYQAYYRMFDDRTQPDAYERHLRPIFPAQRPGSFTYDAEMQKWIWTTFFSFQWDLNYANPEVFRAMLEEMLFLANVGVEVLRLDAVPFIWKQLGTDCENLPEAHMLIQAFNALVRVAAPAMLFKSEAIVHPRNVKSYISWEECPLSYNPILMVSIWEALATQDVTLLRTTMDKRFALPADTAWINYLRSHDDIGWGFADEDAADIGINGEDHRWFLNLYYMGRYTGSNAVGEPFQFQVDPRSHKPDIRISGTLASLIGLEKAMAERDNAKVEQAIRRIILAQGLIMAAGGIPLIYLGDEIATLNDYSYRKHPKHAHDSRWLHRPKMDWARAGQRSHPATVEGRVFQALRTLIQIRKQTPAFANGDTQWLDTGSRHVLGFIRQRELLVLANFSGQPQSLGTESGRWHVAPEAQWTNLIDGRTIHGDDLTLAPYELLWLLAAPQDPSPAQGDRYTDADRAD
ncbi:MAG: DUF3459 domain-containing protein [Anaerolineae bacterium]|nr:DUF3459 domain-containing protein [Anaerolineae bacterium]